MNTGTERLLAQDIRCLRGMLTAQADFARALPPCELQVETYRRVAFWRAVLNDAEARLRVGDVGEVEARVERLVGQV